MKIKIHRGTHQIGGTITEIKTDEARIIIDIGAELPRLDKPDVDNFEIDGVTSGKANCDAVFVTHYHGDHVGMFEKVLPEIPIYMGEVAKQILNVVQRKNKKTVGNFETYIAGKPIQIKDIKVTPYCIDHSAFDAYMLLIEAEGKRILHTGDFRMHGARGRKMPEVFERFAKDIDILIIEGTMLSRQYEKPMTEYELGAKAKELLRDNKNVFVLCSSTNIDTIAEFYNATIENKKPFIVCESDYAKEILDIVTAAAKSSFYKFDRYKVYTYGKQLHDYMNDKGFCFVCRANAMTKRAIKQFPNNLLIYSMWQGYLNKSHPSYNDYLTAFVDNAVLNGSNLIHLHTSGHATADQIKQVCEITKAKTIIPIHSEKPEVFKELGINADIKILNDGESVTL